MSKRANLKFIFIWLFFVFTNAMANDLQTHSVSNENTGQFNFSVPSNWSYVERVHFKFGTTFLNFTPKNGSSFELEIMVNDLSHLNLGDLTNSDLESYLKTNMSQLVSQSKEGRVDALRYGEHQDTVYATLTDQFAKPKEFVLISQGIRLVGKNAILFTLYCNDKNIINKALSSVSKIEFANPRMLPAIPS